ncbi:hypothetical protein F0P96_14085 [Hymenobacter busanensis]|uniref:Uncharacterized protein n=1 Tax=Hymenobacter busanensis TaxID=2607656 RepID=A0A7L5A0L2_9BACT|nr:hypothetical protein [Hymenobacter busanensis]KAA9331372.1 hypothetical protein F0P96_14085 [Hymenobacter busanensis]QHJ08525.1 hypothetical protein GUY19_15010 [Hymenobacter busanensis]
MNVTTQVTLKRVCLAFMLSLFMLPALQAKFNWVKEGALGGYTGTQPATEPALVLDSLTANTYQPALERYLEDHIGFRTWLIRFRNQLQYSLLNVAKANDTVVGEDNLLLSIGGIKDYLGEGFVGDREVQHHVQRFKAVQDSLRHRGKLLVFVIAPAKTTFYAEAHPAYYRRQPRGRSNYMAYAAAMQQAGVNLLDLSRAFRVWKDTASYPLFPRGGFHWSGYGTERAVDTLVHYIEHRTQLDLPDYAVTQLDITDEPRNPDDDIAKAMNLLWPPTAFTMAYPLVQFKPLQGHQKRPDVMLYGDSFGYNLLYPYISELFSPESTFWYYGQQVAYGPTTKGDQTWQLNHREEYLKRDVIIILYNEFNLRNFDGGFSKDLYRLLTPFTAADNARIDSIAEKIRQAPGASDRLWAKASQRNMSQQEVSREEAVEQYERLH